jgi:hypothetical protein
MARRHVRQTEENLVGARSTGKQRSSSVLLFVWQVAQLNEALNASAPVKEESDEQ